MDKVIIFDTTLRDGEQSPGVALTTTDKLEIAMQLAKLGVDVIEAGFPRTSPGDFEAVQTIAREVRGASIAGLAHANPDAVDDCWNAVKVGQAPRIHVFLSSSDIHIAHQLVKDKETRARDGAHDGRPRRRLLQRRRVLAHGRHAQRPRLRLLDARAVHRGRRDDRQHPRHRRLHRARGVRAVHHRYQEQRPEHRQGARSPSTATTTSASPSRTRSPPSRAGARQVETCINGIGERAGNASLEEVVMALKTRKDFFNVETNIKTQELYRASRLVSDLTGMSVQPNKAIVGANAFRHQSGIHQDGILKMRETYEIMDARDIGVPTGGAEIVLGKVSGRHGFKARLEQLGYELTSEELSRAFLAFKELADKKAEIDDRDLEAIVADKLRTTQEMYRLDFVQVSCGDHAQPTATVRLIAPDGAIRSDAAIGTGPVDAVYRAINRIIDVPNELTEFSVKSVTEGIDAQGEVTIRVESNGKTYVGRGADTDIIVASAKAYMNALNRMLSIERRQDSEVRTNP